MKYIYKKYDVSVRYGNYEIKPSSESAVYLSGVQCYTYYVFDEFTGKFNLKNPVDFGDGYLYQQSPKGDHALSRFEVGSGEILRS